ncbi:hypothetical protein E3Q19_02369 [Wallemia mellicola]|nr:hypothetical protein E3Q19_02369 [Wallemia mellicola]
MSDIAAATSITPEEPNLQTPPPGLSAQPFCSHCRATQTPLWRRNPDDSASVLCNACGLFLKLKGMPRPLSLKTDVPRTRKRQKACDKDQNADGTSSKSKKKNSKSDSQDHDNDDDRQNENSPDEINGSKLRADSPKRPVIPKDYDYTAPYMIKRPRKSKYDITEMAPPKSILETLGIEPIPGGQGKLDSQSINKLVGGIAPLNSSQVQNAHALHQQQQQQQHQQQQEQQQQPSQQQQQHLLTSKPLPTAAGGGSNASQTYQQSAPAQQSNASFINHYSSINPTSSLSAGQVPQQTEIKEESASRPMLHSHSSSPIIPQHSTTSRPMSQSLSAILSNHQKSLNYHSQYNSHEPVDQVRLLKAQVQELERAYEGALNKLNKYEKFEELNNNNNSKVGSDKDNSTESASDNMEVDSQSKDQQTPPVDPPRRSARPKNFRYDSADIDHEQFENILFKHYRGAVVEDLDLQPALTVYANESIDKVLIAAYEREFSQVPVLNDESNKKIIGYIDVEKLLKQDNDHSKSVNDYTIRFASKNKRFRVITPYTPLEELDSFLIDNEFAIVTDQQRKFVLGIATRGDLSNFHNFTFFHLLSSRMSSQAGLQRRRVNNNTQNDDSTSSGRNSSSLPSSPRLSTVGRGVAYDPRDLQVEEEQNQHPKLTLMEEVLLLGLKDRQGYLSFWNDNISYALRGCILIELALRKRIAMVRDPNRRRYDLADRLVEVTNDKLTGEVLLDETLKLIKTSEKLSVGNWIDLLSGETWNVMKIGYQLKQVRERLAKGLVDKGVLRTEKKNFLLFDMATHPIVDTVSKRDAIERVLALANPNTVALDMNKLYKNPNVRARVTRSVALLLSGYAASVLENAFATLNYDTREEAFMRTDELLNEFGVWPWGFVGTGSGSAVDGATGIGSASIDTSDQVETPASAAMSHASAAQITNLVRSAKEEVGEDELEFEVIATVFSVFGKMDSLL